MHQVVLIGPESTGKTTLCRLLAEHYSSVWVPEWARRYLEKGGEVKAASDLVFIARMHMIEWQKTAARYRRKKVIFIDTDLHNICVWSKYAFKHCPDWLIQAEERQKADLYLLLHPDVAWVADGLRANAFLREELFLIYKERLLTHARPFVQIRGEGKPRLANCIKAIDEFFKKTCEVKPLEP